MKKCIHFILFFSSLTCLGRFANIEESNQDLLVNSKIKIFRDSKALIEEELLYTVRKEAGKVLGTLDFTYKPKISLTQILHAETRNKGEKSLPVTTDKMEILALIYKNCTTH